jgi:hypothetical protein
VTATTTIEDERGQSTATAAIDDGQQQQHVVYLLG